MSSGNPGVPSSVSENNNDEHLSHVVYAKPEDTLQFRVVPSSEYILNGVANTVQVLFEIKTGFKPKKEEEKRPPLDLAIVLDKSGSMSGPKLEQSKETIKRVIDNLTLGDTLHLIAYDTKVEVIIENGNLKNPEHLKSLVDQIRPGSSTNMGDGLEKASEILLKYKKSAQRIYVFSDGLVNEGVHKTKESIFGLVKKIHDIGISTTAFGIGDDFDEDMMKGIAEYGHSNYFYIEGSEDIDRYVAAALGAMLGRIGTEAVFKIRGVNGSIVKKMWGQESSVLVSGLTIGDIKQNNSKNILVDVEITPSGNKDEQDVVSYSLTFNHQDTKENVVVEGVLKLKKTDNEKLLLTKNEETEIALTMQQAGEMDDEILKMLEQNRINEAIALETKQVSMFERKIESDKSGRVQAAWEKAKKSLENVKQKGNSKDNVKRKKYHQMLKHADSADFLSLQ